MTTETATRNHAKDNATAWFAEIKELVTALGAEEACTNAYYEIEQRIQEGPLSVLVRDGWRSPGQASDDGAEEYEILLSTGGPALRIYGRLNQFDEPESAALQYQDWGTPWTDWYPEDETTVDETARVLRTYAECFYFGG
jgi:hypothetical protein